MTADSLTAQPTDVFQGLLIDPFTGQVVATDSVDQLAEAYLRIKQVKDDLYRFERSVKSALSAATTGDAKTRRVRGDKWRVKLEMPDDTWDQSLLKEAWNSFPALRDSCLKIGTIGVQKREYNKILNENGPSDFETFRNMIRSSNQGPSGNPAVFIEHLEGAVVDEPDAT